MGQKEESNVQTICPFVLNVEVGEQNKTLNSSRL